MSYGLKKFLLHLQGSLWGEDGDAGVDVVVVAAVELWFIIFVTCGLKLCLGGFLRWC